MRSGNLFDPRLKQNYYLWKCLVNNILTNVRETVEPKGKILHCCFELRTNLDRKAVEKFPSDFLRFLFCLDFAAALNLGDVKLLAWRL